MMPRSSAKSWLRHAVFVGVCLAIAPSPSRANRLEGELIVEVRDPAGLPVAARVHLQSRAPLFETTAACNTEGQAHLKRLPFGIYQLRIAHPDFAEFTELLEIRSELPASRQVTLDITPIETTLTVQDSAPLLDPNQTGTVFRLGRDQLDLNPFSTMGRSTINAVNSMPGWLLEANAVLHPRGSEYDTQYVIDGIPLYDNRSLGFAPGFEIDEFETVNVMTANIPAEFGRRLGGVIELYTRRADRDGHHPELTLQGGSFTTNEGAFSDQFRTGRTTLSLGIRGGRTDRYLDPPSLENFTNRGSSAGFNAGLERDLNSRDRISLYLRSNRVNFLVPNDLEQQNNGQRQDRQGSETAGQVHFQRVFSARTLGSLRGMVRDVSAKLWSNPLSIPVFTEQDRGFREGVVVGSFTVEGESHTVKLGGDFRTADIRERFFFAKTGGSQPTSFDFLDSQRATEFGLFVQDHIRWGNLVIDAGIRFDRYHLRIDDSALSPRLGLAYYWEDADLLIRGSYDRIFQTPAVENLLLSTSSQTRGLDAVEGALPLPASRANFYEVGVRKPLGNLLRLDVNHYWRDFENHYDDDVFLNTGISFPISFQSARIEGTEVRLEMPSWRRLSAFVSYSNMLGTATSPVTGGLFIEGGEAGELRDVVTRFPITQDQRNTVSATARYEPHPRLWFAVAGRYGSGLPVELAGDDEEAAGEGSGPGQSATGEPGGFGFALIPPAIIDRVNFGRGRLRPNFSLDLSLGVKLWKKDRRSLSLQLDVLNATDRLNVINFSGLFSGTAIAPTRMIGARLRVRM